MKFLTSLQIESSVTHTLVLKMLPGVLALGVRVLSLVVEGINNEMFTAWQKMEAI